ncbi:MAG: KamA family radical SAM protein [Myxococcota bacterium]|nr:KamA family radical SAM protein [Myxococcota bacterium]
MSTWNLDALLEDTPWQGVPEPDFLDWRWQVRNRITTFEELTQLYKLRSQDQESFVRAGNTFRFATTPYYAALSNKADEDCPIRKQIVPTEQETLITIGERGDPLGEEELEAAPNLIHRYEDRALLLVTDRCPVYCRFCTRRRIVGRVEEQSTRALLGDAFDYIRKTSCIREVILSGGDALMLGDNQIDFILRELRSIPHVEIIRIATRMPVTCPMRITEKLSAIIKKYSPVYVMTHFNHINECTRFARLACQRLVDNGVIVYNQSVLLKGVNDTVDAIRDLNRWLVRQRVTPYYLHQCDMAEGIEHFRTPLQTGIGIIEGLRGHMSGLAVPQLCVDVPGGLGKVTVQPSWIVNREGNQIRFRTYRGETADYFDPIGP